MANVRPLPVPPQTDIAESQLIPPLVEHALIQTKNSVPSHAVRSRHKFCQPVIDTATLRFGDARQQMPERERVPLSRLSQYNMQGFGVLAGSRAFVVEFCERRAERLRRIFKVR